MTRKSVLSPTARIRRQKHASDINNKQLNTELLWRGGSNRNEEDWRPKFWALQRERIVVFLCTSRLALLG